MRYEAIALRSLLAVIACMSLLLLSTCGKDSPTQPKAPEPTPPPPPTPVATRVDVSPTSATLTSVGQTVQLTARVFDQNSAPMNAAVVTWTSSAVGVATVSNQGLVTAVSNGSATITARSGSTSASIAVTVSAMDDNPDREALIALFHATNGPGWVKSDNWLSEETLDTWHGVRIDGSGRVTALILANNGLRGSLPVELGNLEKLNNLQLQENKLTGSIPPELGNLTQLTFLGLANNQLSGSIPPELGNLNKLTVLVLYRNQLLSGPIPPQLGNLSDLESLRISGNRLSGPIPPELGNLSDLESLWLGDNQLTGQIPPELGNLSKLESLSLGDNELSGPVPPELGKLANLKSLVLSGNSQLEGAIPRSFLQLRKLEIMGCLYTNGACLPATDEFREWTRQVEARGIVDFPVLIPYCDEIDRRGLTNLFIATNGTGWGFSNGWLDEDESLDQWYGVQTDSIGRVMSLDLNSNGLAGSVPDALGMLANMKSLKLGNNALSGRLPLSLSTVPLEEFDYAGTSLCVADDAEFQGWLDGIPLHNGTGVLCDPLTERELLASLYWSTGGPQWANSSGWPTDAPLSSWYGVETDDVGTCRGIAAREQ